MAGMPQRRAHRLANGPLVPLRDAPTPQLWRTLPLQARLEHIWGCSMEDVYELGQRPWAKCTPAEMGLKIRVFEVLLKRFFKETDYVRESERQERLAALRDRIIAAAPADVATDEKKVD